MEKSPKSTVNGKHLSGEQERVETPMSSLAASDAYNTMLATISLAISNAEKLSGKSAKK